MVNPGTPLNISLLLVLALAGLAWGAWQWMRRRRERLRWHAEMQQLQRQHESLQHQARQHAAAAERERIYRDLHDDLGARLLDLVYAAPDAALAGQARQALQTLRALVADAQRPPTTLRQLLGELAAETDNRLRSAGRELLWEQDPNLPDLPLDQATTLQLARIVREAVTNALRHAALRWLRVRFYEVDGVLMCDVTDDGHFEDANIGSGTGTRSMRARADDLGGQIAWHPGTLGGTKVTLRVPLAAPHG
jgi:signal transduction histidine kinase